MDPQLRVINAPDNAATASTAKKSPSAGGDPNPKPPSQDLVDQCSGQSSETLTSHSAASFEPPHTVAEFTPRTFRPEGPFVDASDEQVVASAGHPSPRASPSSEVCMRKHSLRSTLYASQDQESHTDADVDGDATSHIQYEGSHDSRVSPSAANPEATQHKTPSLRSSPHHAPSAGVVIDHSGGAEQPTMGVKQDAYCMSAENSVGGPSHIAPVLGRPLLAATAMHASTPQTR